MNCNCNNNGTSGGSSAKIKHVYGNMLKLAIPLTLRTLEEVDNEIVATDTDFIPSSHYPVIVELSKEGRFKLTFYATMRDGNIAYFEDDGTIPVGTYAITVLCRDDNGQHYRFKQKTVVQVFDYTKDAGIETPIEYEVTTWYLDAAIFMALKGEDGVGVDDITIEESGEVGGTNTITITLTDGTTKVFHVLNGSGSTDTEFNQNSLHPIANSVVTNKFAQIDTTIAGLFGDVDYDSQSKSIRFWDKGKANILVSLDARPFIKDGMVNSVYISNNTLVITFNTDAGREAIGVSLSSIFNPNNYYTKTQVDNRIFQAINEATIGISQDFNERLPLFIQVTQSGNSYTSNLGFGAINNAIQEDNRFVVAVLNNSVYYYLYTISNYSISFSCETFEEHLQHFLIINNDNTWTEEEQVIEGGSGGSGTVTAVKMNNGSPISPDSNGVVNLGTVITSHQDISGKADKSDTYTKTEVDNAIAGLVDSAPTALDTLNELAAALGDDANFATTVTNALAGKQDKQVTYVRLYDIVDHVPVFRDLSGNSISNNDFISWLFDDSKEIILVGNDGQQDIYLSLKTKDGDSTEFSAVFCGTPDLGVFVRTSFLKNNKEGFIVYDALTPAYLPSAASTAPPMDGTASVGSSANYARQDHVHPSDTSRVPTSRTINGHALSSDITLDSSDLPQKTLIVLSEVNTTTTNYTPTFTKGNTTLTASDVQSLLADSNIDLVIRYELNNYTLAKTVIGDRGDITYTFVGGLSSGYVKYFSLVSIGSSLITGHTNGTWLFQRAIASNIELHATMDENDNLVFTDADSNTLTHAQVVAIFSDTQNNVTLFDDDNSLEYKLWYRGEDNWVFYEITDSHIRCLTLSYVSNAIIVDDSYSLNYVFQGDLKSINGQSLTDGIGSNVYTLVFGQKSNTGFMPATYSSTGHTWSLAQRDLTPSSNTLYFDVVTRKCYVYGGEEYKQFLSLGESDFNVTTTQNGTVVFTIGNDTYTIDLNHTHSQYVESSDLATVATSGDYDDLTNKPTIPAAQVQANWNESDSSSKAYIQNKPTIPTVPTNVSSFTNDAGYLTSHQDISGKADVVPIVTVSTTGAVTQALDPNKFYSFTGSPTSLTLTLTSGTGLCVYAGKFTAGTGFSGLTLPSSVKEGDGIPTIEAGGTYEFSIVDNLLLMVKEASAS